MQTNWTVFLHTRTETKARKVLGWMTDHLGREPDQLSLEPLVLKEPERTTYLFLVKFSLRLEATVWNDAVVEAIALGQRVGSRWQLSGDVMKELAARTDFPSVSGLGSLEYRLSDSTHPLPA